MVDCEFCGSEKTKDLEIEIKPHKRGEGKHSKVIGRFFLCLKCGKVTFREFKRHTLIFSFPDGKIKKSKEKNH